LDLSVSIAVLNRSSPVGINFDAAISFIWRHPERSRISGEAKSLP
jgi:hypothetical protein